jgi:hypothetical protein
MTWRLRPRSPDRPVLIGARTGRPPTENVREVEEVGPRRKLQLAFVLVAAVVVALALTGAVGPASGDPVPTAVVTH